MWKLGWYYNFYFALCRSTMSGNARCSHRRCSARRSVLRNFAKVAGKHLCQGLFFNRVAGQPFLWNTSERLLLKCLNKKSKRKWWTKLLFQKSNRVLIYQAKIIIFLIFFHTQSEVFFQIKFHPGMKLYSFHPGMKFTCKQIFLHPRTSFILGWDFVSVTCKRTVRNFFIAEHLRRLLL